MENEIIQQREALQDDLLTILDGLESDVLENVCNAVIERFDILLEASRNKTGN